MESEGIISSHIVHSEMECSMKCLGEQTCVDYNFRPKSKKHEINCQLGGNSSLERDMEIVKNGEWVFSQDLETLRVSELYQLAHILTSSLPNRQIYLLNCAG